MAVRHCISRGSRYSGRVRDHVRGSYRQTMFYSPVAFSRASGGYQDRPSPVNNQIRGARKSLLLAQKAPMVRPTRGQGAEERGIRDIQRTRPGTPGRFWAPWNERRILAVPRCRRSRTGARRRIRRSFALRKEFTFKLHQHTNRVNQGIQYFFHTLSRYVRASTQHSILHAATRIIK